MQMLVEKEEDRACRGGGQDLKDKRAESSSAWASELRVQVQDSTGTLGTPQDHHRPLMGNLWP